MYDYALYGSSLNTLGTLGLIALVLAIAATLLVKTMPPTPRFKLLRHF